jgi:undecaprenyl-diphosphatase
MDLIKAIIMGLVQGIAEFLPISSDGHLALMKYILHINTDNGILFDVLLHFGTLVAVFCAFWKDIWELIVEGLGLIGDVFINGYRMLHNLRVKEKTEYKKIVSNPSRKLVMLIIVATIPTGIIGVVFDDAIEIAGQSLLVPGLGLVLTGLLLMIADRVKTGKKKEMEATYKQAGIIGTAQGLAILPGLSRSGSTITACLIGGYDRTFAVKYSFIMSIPAVLGAVVFKVKDAAISTISHTVLTYYMIGMIVAAMVGYISIKTMLVIVKGKKFKYFAYYCITIGIIAVICYFAL